MLWDSPIGKADVSVLSSRNEWLEKLGSSLRYSDLESLLNSFHDFLILLAANE